MILLPLESFPTPAQVDRRRVDQPVPHLRRITDGAAVLALVNNANPFGFDAMTLQRHEAQRSRYASL